MNFRGNIQNKMHELGKGNMLGQALHKAFFRIMCGYLGGTIIGLIIRSFLHG